MIWAEEIHKKYRFEVEYMENEIVLFTDENIQLEVPVS